MECKICGSEIEDTDKECPICSTKIGENINEFQGKKHNDTQISNDEKVIKNNKKKMTARCVESGYETKIDEDTEKFYCEECGFEHIINGDDFIKIPMEQEIKKEIFIEKETDDTQISSNEKVIKNNKKKMIARCKESGYETEIDEDTEYFYCEECGIKHKIDEVDFIKIPITEEIKKETLVEKEQVEEALYLFLKENEKEFIKVLKSGGTVGRDGDYGSDLFTKHSMLTVSRQHIKIESNKIGDWIVWHLSQNSTEINGEKMSPDSPKILKNNDELTLSKKISFRVEIK